MTRWYIGLINRFARDHRGVAATEFAVISPIFIIVLFGVAGIGGAITSQFSVERKVRLAVEGVIRYGWDDAKIRAFANASGASAFGLATQGDGVALDVSRYRICRATEPLIEVPAINTPPCLKPELWVKIIATKSVAGPFNTRLNLRSSADVMAEP